MLLIRVTTTSLLYADINDMLIVIEMFLFMVSSRFIFRSRKGNIGSLQQDSFKAINGHENKAMENMKEIEAGVNANNNHSNNGITQTVPVTTAPQAGQDIAIIYDGDIHLQSSLTT